MLWRSQTQVPPKKLYVKTALSLPGPPVYRSTPHGFIHRLSSTQPHRFHPSASALTSVSVRVSPSLPSHMHVSFVHRTHVTHPCVARIAHCPPAGLIPRYRLDEFMSEVISIFPCSKPLSGGSQALWLVLESHLFSFFSSPFGTLKAVN